MRPETFQRLLNINKEFYQSFGHAFAQTRHRLQPGVKRVLAEWIHGGDWLDVGCGSGVLAQAWGSAGLKGTYTGIDFSAALLEEAAALMAISPAVEQLTIQFKRVDLVDEDWVTGLVRGGYDGVVSFAVLHHIPGAAYRQRLLEMTAELLKPGGLFIHSVWQFQHSPKLMSRVQPWGRASLREDEVEEGDTLLDWRSHCNEDIQESGLRYVHLFSREELGVLAKGAGFEVLEEFESDGKGERLGLYQVWRLKGS